MVVPPPPALVQFNFDFPGGTPGDLVSAIEKATGQPLNAIIPSEDANVQLPPLRMNQVFVPQLFAALAAASRKSENIPGFGFVNTDYGFRTDTGDSDASGQPPRIRRIDNNPNLGITDDSIWYFYVDRPQASPQKDCLFFSLAPYLDHGFTVDDITTAIRTAWEMQSGSDSSATRPDLSFHKETKLLIAVGDQQQLEMIGQMLKTLLDSDATTSQIDSLKQKINIMQKQIDELINRRTPGFSSPDVPPAKPAQ
jgi:hypothetical protein